jgi:hypothetical protein
MHLCTYHLVLNFCIGPGPLPVWGLCPVTELFSENSGSDDRCISRVYGGGMNEQMNQVPRGQTTDPPELTLGG